MLSKALRARARPSSTLGFITTATSARLSFGPVRPARKYNFTITKFGCQTLKIQIIRAINLPTNHESQESGGKVESFMGAVSSNAPPVEARCKQNPSLHVIQTYRYRVRADWENCDPIFAPKVSI